METVFAQLKQARESRNMSVADVATATNINPDFLRAIEEGKTTILPQAYVRAFLREFASVVGLDPQRVMEEYDAGPGKADLQGSSPMRKREEVTVPQPEPAGETPSGARKSGWTAAAAVVAVVVLGTILYWNFSRAPELRPQRPAESPREASPEEEKTVMKRPVPPEVDSLQLTARTSDTVWVQVIIDSRDSLDFMLQPNVIRRWTASKFFKVSVGRSEAVRFALNETEIGLLGTDPGIVRGVLIDRGTLSRLRQGKQP